MKTIGLIGGMSWESSVEYYRVINEAVRDRLGGYHSAKSVMVSVDFAEIEILQERGDWETAARALIEAARNVEKGGADFLLLCTNTMHRVAEEIQGGISIPLLHIADATAARVKAHGLSRIGLLGTRFTMEEAFYRGRLTEKHGLEVVVPDPAQRQIVHRVIFDELVLGTVNESSRAAYAEIMEDMVRGGAQGIILGCTEIGLLVRDGCEGVPLFDTAVIHALAAVEFALAD
jgi:aspartate racemase